MAKGIDVPVHFKPQDQLACSSPRQDGLVVRSMMGKQADSRKTNAPAASFSSSKRDGAKSQYLSSGHLNAEKLCTESPGAIYTMPSSFSKQVETSKSTGRSCTLSTTEERKSLARKDITPGPGAYNLAPGAMGSQPLSSKCTSPVRTISPAKESRKQFLTAAHVERELKGTQGSAPGTYEAASSLGKQPLSARQSGLSCSWSASKEERGRGVFGSPTRKSIPPVGSYETLPSLGKQPLSQLKTAPAFGFGKGSSWEQENKRYLSPSHAQLAKGTSNPGTYFDHQTDKTLSTFGKQVLSDRPCTGPASMGGTSPRKVFKKVEATPGPGSYSV